MSRFQSITNCIHRNLAVVISLAMLSANLFQVTTTYGSDPATRPAETRPTEFPLIKTWVSDLAHPDASLRAEALANLLKLEAADLPRLRRVIEENGPLAPAQAAVIREVVTQVFLSGEAYEGVPISGFLGIHMEPVSAGFRNMVAGDSSSSGKGVVVTDRMPGFGGARSLRDGDVILSIIERPDTSILNPPEFMMAVRTMSAGTIIHFQVLRQGQVIRVPVRLDARPVDADQIGILDDFIEHRRLRAEEYWSTHFAALVKQGIS